MKLITLRICCFLLLLSVAWVSNYLAPLAGLTAFGPGSNFKRGDHEGGLFTYSLYLIPALLLWIPHRAALIIGGVMLALPSFIAIIVGILIPFPGIALIVPFLVWYWTAIACWRSLGVNLTLNKT